MQEPNAKDKGLAYAYGSSAVPDLARKFAELRTEKEVTVKRAERRGYEKGYNNGCLAILKLNNVDKLILAAPELLAACEAAIKYDLAIASCGNEPHKMASFCTAEGVTLDDLYASWITKAKKAIAKTEGK